MLTWQLGHPTLKNVKIRTVKQTFWRTRSFVSKDGRGRLLGPLLDVLEPSFNIDAEDSDHFSHDDEEDGNNDTDADGKKIFRKGGGKKNTPRFSQTFLRFWDTEFLKIFDSTERTARLF